MADDTPNLVLEQLRALRSDVQTFRDDMKDEFRHLAQRVNSLELNVALLHQDFAGISTRMDSLSQRIDRIDRRLGLIDA